MANNVPMNVLTIDGGGIRGVSALLILESVMERIRDKEGLDTTPIPCEYFDFIGGTSTGGIIAVMLGRLRMTIGQCLEAYKEMAEKAFTPKRGIHLPGRPSGAYSATELEGAIKNVVSQQCRDTECRERGKCRHTDMVFRDPTCCKTVVLAITKANVDAPPTLFKTYDRSDGLKDCTIWQVARATSAATTFFKPIKCGRDGIEFIDAGFGYNNPSEIILTEAKQVFPNRQFGCILSIGTGLGGVVGVEDTRWSIFQALKKMATSSKKVADRLAEAYVGGEYFRFNVTLGLDAVKLSDWEESSKIAAHTRNYLECEKVRLALCSERLQTRGQVLGASGIPGQQSQGVDLSSSPDSNALPTVVPKRVSNHKANRFFEVPLDTNRNYVDRVTLTQNLDESFGFPLDNSHGPVAAVRRVALFGLGGSGKTELAIRFAERHRNDYEAVFWINGMNEARINDGCRTIAMVTGERNMSELQDPIEEAQRWLTRNEGWLLIVDNMDDDPAMDMLRGKFLTVGMSGHILITSRNPSAALHWNAIEVGDMKPEEARRLLGNIIGQTASGSVVSSQLLNDLGHLPLAIDQAASYIRNMGSTVEEYLEWFKTRKRRLLQQHPTTQYNHESRQTVMTTWDLSFDTIRGRHPKAAKLLLMLSLLSTDGISLNILECDGQRYWAPNGEFEEVPWDQRWIPEDLLEVLTEKIFLKEAITALRRFSLVRLQAGGSSLWMHPLVQFWASQQLSRDSILHRQLTICVTGLISSQFQQQDLLLPCVSPYPTPASSEERSLRPWPWRQYPELVPHVFSCIRQLAILPGKHMPEVIAHRALSLLQVFEYSSLGSLQDDETAASNLIDQIANFLEDPMLPDDFLRISILTWRLMIVDRHGCGKSSVLPVVANSYRRTFMDPNNTGESLSCYTRCNICTKSIKATERFIQIINDGRREPSRRSIAAKWPMAFLYGKTANRTVVDTVKAYIPSREEFKKVVVGECVTEWSILSPKGSTMERYFFAVLHYFGSRSLAEPTYPPSEVLDLLKHLCGLHSEEYRRAAWYVVKEMKTRQEWHAITELLDPLVKDSITSPVQSWSHERCITLYLESLIEHGMHRDAKDFLTDIRNAYRKSGKELTAAGGMTFDNEAEGESCKLLSRDIQVFVKTFTGKTVTINTTSHATVHSVLAKVSKREGWHMDEFRLIFGGKQLHLDRLISDYNIQKESTVHAVLRLSGG